MEILMSDNVTNELLLETLKAIRADIAGLRDELLDAKADIRGVKAHMAAFMQSEVSRDGALASVQQRLDRIERRLELAH